MRKGHNYMITSKRSAAKVGISCLLIAALFLSSNTHVTPISVPVSATNFVGDFDSGDFDVWDGVSYDFSWFNPDLDSYEISSAAQLASLSILTNDLSQGFDTWAGNLPSSCNAYKAVCYDFSDKTITLTADIDLCNYDWLPISYPFDTPNPTHTDFDALSHVPAYLTAVDEWVGDGNGNKIITRYLEFPESEMRFRDLLYLVNSDDEINARTTHTASNTGYVDCSYLQQAALSAGNNDILGYAPLISAKIRQTGATHFDSQGRSYTVVDMESSFARVNPLVSEIKELTSTDIIESYTYKDVHAGGAVNRGFNGKIDGNNKRIKGLHPVTAWTTDYEERLTTFDPIGKGLVGVLDESGEITDLAVKGYYDDNDIVSYSAILCAYNYGEITNCYVDGQMSSGLIRQNTPVTREYGEYSAAGDIITPSIYTFNGSRTVLPVGNAGFVTAYNGGTIKECTSAGEATKVFRQFGFIACINEGTITDCRNTANLSSTWVDWTFHTDEYGGQTLLRNGVYTLYDLGDSSVSPFYSDYSSAISNLDAASNSSFYSGTDITSQAGRIGVEDWLTVNFSGWGASLRDDLNYTIAAFYQGSTITGIPWVPDEYKTTSTMSLAANHLYGIYGFTAVGGICAINRFGGIIEGCENSGNLTALANTSGRMDVAKQMDMDNYNYIRPGNAFGLFSTQSNTVNYVSGIAALNKGVISDSSNRGAISKRDYTSSDTYTIVDTNVPMIMFTKSGYYRNDCIVYNNDYVNNGTLKYNPLGTRWWASFCGDEDYYIDKYGICSWDTDYHFVADVDPDTGAYLNSLVVNGETLYEYSYVAHDVYNYGGIIENMPYPAVRAPFDKDLTSDELHRYSISRDISGNPATITLQLAAGISAMNTGSLYNVTNEGAADYGIVHFSYGTDTAPAFINAVQNYSGSLENLGFYLYNTNVGTSDIRNGVADFGIARILRNAGVHTSVNNVHVITGKGGFCKIYSDDNRVHISKVYITDTTNSGYGMAVYALNADFNTIHNFQDSDSGLSSALVNVNIDNTFMYGRPGTAGIGNGTLNNHMHNVYYCGPDANYAIGGFTNGEISDVYVYQFDENNDLVESNCVLKALNCSIDNIVVFNMSRKTVLDCDNCTVKNVIVYTDTPQLASSGIPVFRFNNCDCEDMLLESAVDITWHSEDNGVQQLPGMLKDMFDTNTFRNVVVQLPQGTVSYNTFNYMLGEDKSIRSDAYLDYDPDARTSGSLAYWADHGNSEDRTYNYTVADTDTVNILAVSDDSTVLCPADYVPADFVADFNLPAYTRRIQNDNEQPYYRVLIPYNSNGAGEVRGSVMRNDITYTTKCLSEKFPVTSLFVKDGETYDLSVIARTGYGLEKLESIEANSVVTTEIEIDRENPMPFTMNSVDITYIGTWSNVYSIEVDDNDDILIKPSADASLPGAIVYVDTLIQRQNSEIGSVWYYNYKKDTNNRWVLDPTSKVEIFLDDMSFVMPHNPVKIFASLLGTECSVDEFVLAGVSATIDNVARTITVDLQDSVDLTSLAPSVFNTTGVVSISPDITAPQDFSKPVCYVLECENGNRIEYYVYTRPLIDGRITYFEILGYDAVIDQDSCTIDITLPSSLDLTDILPNIVWSGSSITPSGNVDLSVGTFEYVVTSSTGDQIIYTVVIHHPDVSKELSLLSITLSNGQELVFEIDESTHIATVSVPYGTDVSNCRLSNILYNAQSSNIGNGATLNLTKGTYIVLQKENGDTTAYLLTVNELPSTEKVIVQFMLYGVDGVIDNTLHTVQITLDSKYDISNIAPDVVTFVGESISDISEKHNWNTPAEYTITAYDGSTVTYTVSVAQV